jgi:putative toxin-antitoxin system antitoxin component (TIGR02293 family)
MYLPIVTEMLGGKKILGQEIRTQMDLISLSRRGITKASLVHLAAYMGSPVSKVMALLPVTLRTIQRYSSQDHLNKVVSEYVLHIAEVVARGEEVFGDRKTFMNWLEQPSTPFGGQSPESLLNSRIGTDMVLDELMRLEHGIVS